ncbi:MAG: hypothetical protein ACRD2S_04325 [Terriglobales bacterium]
MTEHTHNERNEEVRFERRDLTSRAILGSLVALAVLIAVVYFIVLGTYRFGSWYESTHQTAQNPMAEPAEADTRDMNPTVTRARIDKNFSQPRLETNERTENNDFRLEEEQKLHSYGWVDQQSGAVRIPIDRAMDLIAQRGLNTTPRAGTTPESVVNTISAAAARADHSEGNAEPQSKKTIKPKGRK